MPAAPCTRSSPAAPNPVFPRPRGFGPTGETRACRVRAGVALRR